ncbi:Structural maintenance of chromosomes protein 3 [Cladochytrium tenue]|nr:Structural maintenance of chromosomes protein 3 [Cladochytrium tenue]
MPEYNDAVSQEQQALQRKLQMESEHKQLLDKQGRGRQFATTRERDAFLNTEIRELEDNNASNDERLNAIETEVVNSRRQLRELRDSVESGDHNMESFRDEMDANAREIETLRNQRNRLDERRNTSSAIQAIKRIASKMNLRGVYGPLYELFEVDDRYKTAVEVIGGASLFHVVVDTDDTASLLLEQLNRDRSGRVTFMPLNRLRPKETTYPAANDAVPMGSLTGGYIDARKSKLEMVKAMKTWERRLTEAKESLAKTKQELQDVESDLSRCRDRLVRLEARKAELTNMRESIAMDKRTKVREEQQITEAISKKSELRTPLQRTLTRTEAARLGELSLELDRCKAEVSELAMNRAKLEARKNILTIELDMNLKRQRNSIVERLESSSLPAGGIAASLDPERSLDPRREELNELQRRTDSILQRLQEIDSEIERLENSSRDQRAALDKAKTEQSEGNRGLERQQRNLERYLQKKALLIKRKDECSRNIRDLGVLPEEALRDDAVWGTMPSKRLLSRLHEVNESLKRFGHVNKKAFEQYNNFTKQRDSLNTRKDELDESAKAIEDLIQVLDQRKDEAIERTFKQVALHFGEVWRKLVPNGRGKLVMISKMTSAGEAGDDDDDGRGEEMEDIETQGSSSRLKSSIDRYSGVGISVSFSTSRRRGTGDMDDGEDGDGEEVEAAEETQELKRMNQLSGGQKSLVALALIFAIQMCDPAPFYLFDEIDAALDAQYRTAVANMVHELSEKAQFITTTFRPELLHHADKFYGVTFTNKVSRIQAITREDAMKFVDQEQTQ